MKQKGYILHETRVNGHNVAVIATMQSKNEKTGNMVQLWAILTDTAPVAAVKSGLDAATICKGCPFASGGGCYVQVCNAPTSIFKAYHRGNYTIATPRDYARIFGGRMVRFGAYGNPTVLPLALVHQIAKHAAGWTGYMHDWHMMTDKRARAYGQYFMASTETASSLCHATRLGLRSFHASPCKPAGSIECLADSHGLTCADCRLCAGNSKVGAKSIWIHPHGFAAKKASQAALK